jgi:hypothetical protein
MADLSPDPDSNGNTSDDTGGTPRWVKVFGIIAIILVLLLVIMHFTVGGFGGHGAQQP